MSGIQMGQKQGTNSGKPVRGTAIVLRRGALLLVQERANVHYSFPGGAHNTGETWMCTAVRELKEELSLNVRTAERLDGSRRAKCPGDLEQAPCGRTHLVGSVTSN